MQISPRNLGGMGCQESYTKLSFLGLVILLGYHQGVPQKHLDFLFLTNLVRNPGKLFLEFSQKDRKHFFSETLSKGTKTPIAAKEGQGRAISEILRSKLGQKRSNGGKCSRRKSSWPQFWAGPDRIGLRCAPIARYRECVSDTPLLPANSNVAMSQHDFNWVRYPLQAFSDHFLPLDRVQSTPEVPNPPSKGVSSRQDTTPIPLGDQQGRSWVLSTPLFDRILDHG